MVEPLPAAELGLEPKPPQYTLVLSALLRTKPELSVLQGCDWRDVAGSLLGNTPPILELQGDNLSRVLCAKGFCLPHPTGRPWEEVEKFSDVSHLKLKLPGFCHGAMVTDPGQLPLDLVILYPLPHAFSMPLGRRAASWNAP